MCGLAGYVGHQIEPNLLDRMSEAVRHRGPDDCGTWADDGVGLAFRRLSIIDLSYQGHQPMFSADGRYVIIFNGEIYNYVELRKELESDGVSFRSRSDTEVLLAAYVRWGVECLTKLNGMWSIVIWDRRERRLFASRDRFGEKPFYYVHYRDSLIFGSEIKAILSTGLVKPGVNPKMIADFCGDRVLDHTQETCFKDILQLPAGHYLEWQQGQLKIAPYWVLDEAASGESDGHVDVQEVVDLIQDAVRLRLRADTPVGVLLSGGLDSSTVACMTSRLSSNGVHAFSTIEYNLSEEAAGIAHVEHACENVSVHSDLPTVDSFVSDLRKCLWHQEEPFADGSMVAHFRLMRLARSVGVKVLLTGQGADEVFAGYPGYLAVHLAGLLKSGLAGEYLRFSNALRQTGQRAQDLSAFGYALPGRIKSKVRMIRTARGLDWLHPDCRTMSKAIVNGYDIARPREALNDALSASIRQRTLPGFLHYEDRNSMAFGVESRIPFLDYRLVTRMQCVAGGAKVRGGITKAILRDAVRDIVPRPIVERKGKQGYPAPLGQWLRVTQPDTWKRWLEDVKRCPLLLWPQWSRYHLRFMNGDDSVLPQVWRGLILAMWYGMFIEP